MKLKHVILTALLGLFLWMPLSAKALGLIHIGTPYHKHTFTNCAEVEEHIIRWGTVAHLVLNCATRYSVPQEADWLPGEHPDGLTLRFQSWIRVSNLQEGLFLRCEMVNYSRTVYDGVTAMFECLEDPLVVASRGGR